MYHNFVFQNTTEALPHLLRRLLSADEVGSRNGRMREMTHVGITLTKPWQREILNPKRKANIAAQIAETAWVLSGRDDVDWLSNYLPRASDYSDDGETWRGGYGPRLRKYGAQSVLGDYGSVTDQLQEVTDLLRRDRLSRRAAMTIFDPAVDFAESKDIPCNNWITFSSRLGKLDMHVGIRSNDVMWGWSGINAFEWSVIQEIMAGMLGVHVGGLHFSTTSLHLYEQHWAKAEQISQPFPHQLKDSPRFNETGMDGWQSMDYMLEEWFQVEQNIRDGNVHDSQIEEFPEPMFQSWLRVLRWWWTSDNRHLEPLRGTRLSMAAAVGLQPMDRTDGKAVPYGSEHHPSGFMDYVCETHVEKHRAYGDSWKRRGEMLGIMANIARKIDRLDAGTETSDETSADTAMDLFVYLAKYRTWLHGGTASDTPEAANSLMQLVEAELDSLLALGENELRHVVEVLTKNFDRLEDAVKREDRLRHEIVDDMLLDAYVLARHRWDAAQPADGYLVDEGTLDQYLGADHE